jgi:hypothetical protein
MQIIKLYKDNSFLEKGRRLDQTCSYSISLSKLLIDLAVINSEPKAKELRSENLAYKGNQGLMID